MQVSLGQVSLLFVFFFWRGIIHKYLTLYQQIYIKEYISQSAYN